MPIGTGMSALAGVLTDLGYNVSGSDVKNFFFTEENLKKKNIHYTSFNKKNITDDKIYIASTCYDEKNIEVKTIKDKKLRFYYYQDFISSFFEGIKIGVSGTHGKTTTTSIITNMFKKRKIASLVGDSTGIANKNYQYFIFEACEYKEHFLSYSFDYLIINNIDFDHPDYFKNVDEVINTFQKAAVKAKTLIINGDDNNLKKIQHNQKITFGLNDNCDIAGRIIAKNEKGYYIFVKCMYEEKTFFLPEQGLHMVYNFLASLAVSYLNDISLDEIRENIKDYKRPLRRMEEHYYQSNILIDDYAHHPKEIFSCISGIKQKYPNKKLAIVFQPHTYSRTIALSKEFNDVLSKADEVFIAKTFTSKREKESKLIESKIYLVFKDYKVFDDEALRKIIRYKNRVILFLGAGTINSYIEKIMKINVKIVEK